MKLKQRAIAAAYAQFGRPTGFWGRVAGLVMANRSSNRRRNAWAVSLLEVQPDDRVLELGYGPGLAILELSRMAQHGYICGIDHSELMLRQASRRNVDGIRRGLVDLRLGSVDELPDFEAPFDKILAVNAVLFWGDSDARIEALGRLLRPGGLIAVAHQPPRPGSKRRALGSKGPRDGSSAWPSRIHRGACGDTAPRARSRLRAGHQGLDQSRGLNSYCT